MKRYSRLLAGIENARLCPPLDGLPIEPGERPQAPGPVGVRASQIRLEIGQKIIEIYRPSLRLLSRGVE